MACMKFWGGGGWNTLATPPTSKLGGGFNPPNPRGVYAHASNLPFT
jgi:hypothetical protein